MDVKKFPMLIVGVVVALVLAGAVLPVFAETTSATDTFTNEGYYRMSKTISDDTTDITLIWDYTKPNTITVNDEDIVINADVTVSLLSDTNFVLRMLVNGGSVVGVQFYTSNGGAFSATIADSTSMSVVCSSGTATATVGETTRTANYDVVYYPDSNGDYVMKKGNDKAYMLNDSEFFGCGTTTTTSTNSLGVVISGTIEDGADISIWRDLSGTTVIDTESVNIDYSKVNSYIDLNELSKITFNVSNVDDVYNITYSYFIVPYEVMAEKAIHPDGALSVMLNILPLLAIAGLVTGAVVWFISRKG